MSKISIVIPAHNEEENIVEAIRKVEDLMRFEHELVVVNDHSIDNTRQLVDGLKSNYLNLRLIDNINRKGFANALKAGFQAAQGEAVVPLMADLCDELDTIVLMRAKINDGFDLVCASRYIKGGARLGGSKLKGFFSCFVGRSLKILLGLPTSDIANAFKMYRKNVLDGINIESSGFEISMEIPLKAYFKGFKITEVPTVWKERTRGKSSFRMLKLLPNYLKWYLWAIKERLF
jgi:glycosyltransferase involved in cell wall biosynthesis